MVFKRRENDMYPIHKKTVFPGSFKRLEKLWDKYPQLHDPHPIDFYGGEEALLQRKVLDEQKKRLCEENNVRLIEWGYDLLPTDANIKKVIKTPKKDKHMKSILIKDTTKEEREQIVKNSLDCGGGCENCSSCWLGGGSPWDIYQDYIDGKKEIREINMEYMEKYRQDRQIH